MSERICIGIFGTTIREEHINKFRHLIETLLNKNAELIFYKPFADSCINNELLNKNCSTFSSTEDLVKNFTQFVISIGGDGTFLDAIPFINDSLIPITGINFGKLGFLTLIDENELESSLNDLLNQKFEVEHRSLLKIQSETGISYPFALNDISFKSEKLELLNIDVYIDGMFLNTYFGDGLIISTPTGSTAYSLSCGGPLLPPENKNFIITPIASHTLTVRPLVIPETSKIEVRISGEEPSFFTMLDSKRFLFTGKHNFLIEKAPFCVNTIRLNSHSFFDAIRNKLMWGFDIRKK